jgi:hypothetical protein
MRLERTLPSLIALLAAPAAARAQEPPAERVGEGIFESAHTVDIEMRRDHALLTVERTAFNDGSARDPCDFSIVLPAGAAATGFALGGGSGAWFSGVLTDPSEAMTKLGEGRAPETGHGVSAVLGWESRATLSATVFPCAPGTETKVRITLVAPTYYAAGRYVLPLEAMGTEALPARALVRADGGHASHADGGPFQLRAAVEIEHRVELEEPVVARLGSVAFDGERSMTSFQFDAAREISEVPDAATVVVILDASRSLSEDERRSSIAAASAYLEHFGPKSRAAVLEFHRTVRDVSGGLVTAGAARAALAALAAAPLTRKNGSEVGLALEQAGRVLAGAPAGSARRILLLTDARTRSGLDEDALASVLPKDALLHVGLVQPGTASAELTRQTRHPWEGLPAATGGLLWSFWSTTDEDGARARRLVFEEWARPTRIHDVRVEPAGDGGPLEPPSVPDELLEGERIEAQWMTDEPVVKITLSGRLWSRPFAKSSGPDAAFGRRWAALAFGTSLTDSLTDKQVEALATIAGAVSPATSYLAQRPGGQPHLGWKQGRISPIGIGRGTIGMVSGASVSSGRPVPKVDLAPILRAALAGAAKACGVTPGAAAVTVESTHTEIVAVTVSVAGEAAGGPKARCLGEAAWALELGDASDHLYLTTKVEL